MEIKTNKPRRFILVGAAASGKDYMRKRFQDMNFTYAISFTTRPPRDGEQNGVDYFFLTETEFQKMIDDDEFYEHVSFNGWHYGTSKKQFESNDVFIMTPYGISKLKPEDRAESFIMYFDIPLEVRKDRLSKRSDADSVDRRILADEKDFKDFVDYDIKITNYKFDDVYLDKLLLYTHGNLQNNQYIEW
jgi:guanylate kinase